MERMPDREAVHRALAERHGEEMQHRWDNASVAVCGLGGLGSHIAVALARAGVGRLHLLDFDRVDLANLNRQNYKMSQIGRYKTEAMRENLAEIAPYAEVVTDTVRVTEENLTKLLAADGVICEAFDRAEQKAMLADGVLSAYPKKYLVAASGMAGLGSGNAIQTRRVSSHFYLCGDAVSDSADGLGLVASRVMLCAAHQAHMVLRILAGEYDV